MLPNIKKLKQLPPSLLLDIAENLQDFVLEIRRYADKCEFDAKAKVSQFQRHNDLRACCDLINKELDKGCDIEPAISRAYQKNGNNQFTMADLRWFWLNVGKLTRPRRQKMQRARRVMQLYWAGMTDKDIAQQMQQESPSWANIHYKTVSKVKREALAMINRGDYH